MSHITEYQSGLPQVPWSLIWLSSLPGSILKFNSTTKSPMPSAVTGSCRSSPWGNVEVSEGNVDMPPPSVEEEEEEEVGNKVVQPPNQAVRSPVLPNHMWLVWISWMKYCNRWANSKLEVGSEVFGLNFELLMKSHTNSFTVKWTLSMKWDLVTVWGFHGHFVFATFNFVTLIQKSCFETERWSMPVT